jgi:hypothetical protein
MVRPQFLFVLLVLPPLVLYAAAGSALAVASRVDACDPGGAADHAGRAGLGQGRAEQDRLFRDVDQSGFGLVNHSVEFIELAPERYATVRDILLKHRDERIAAAAMPATPSGTRGRKFATPRDGRCRRHRDSCSRCRCKCLRASTSIRRQHRARLARVLDGADHLGA